MRKAWEERNEGMTMKEDQLEDLYSIFVSIFAVGGMLGGFSGGMFANRFGRCSFIHQGEIIFRFLTHFHLFLCHSRKGGLLLNNLLGIAGGIILGVTKSTNFYELLILGRFIIGVNCGESICPIVSEPP